MDNISSNWNDACLTNNGVVAFTDFKNKSTNCSSLIGRGFVPVSMPFSSGLLIPYGICQFKRSWTMTLNYLSRWWTMNRKDINRTGIADVWSDTWYWPVTSFVSTSTRKTVRLGCLLYHTKSYRTVTVTDNKTSDSTSELMILSYSGRLPWSESWKEMVIFWCSLQLSF